MDISELIIYFFGFRVPFVVRLAGWILFVPQLFCSKGTCPHPDFPKDGRYEPKKAEYEVGDTITYICNEDWTKMTLFGISTRTCQETGKWTQSTPYCERHAKIRNVSTTPGIDITEFPELSSTCYTATNGSKGIITVSLESPATVYCVMVLLIGNGIVTVYTHKDEKTPNSEKKICLSHETKIENKYEWTQLCCPDNDLKAQFTSILVSSQMYDYIWACEVKVYVKSDEWCESPPENSVANSQLEISRRRAVLHCDRGDEAKDNGYVYGTCKSGKWSFVDLQCTDLVCDSVIGNVSPSEGMWISVSNLNELSVGTKKTLKCRPGYATEGTPLTVACNSNGTWTETSATCKKENSFSIDYKVLTIVLGCVLLVVKIVFLSLAIYLRRKKKHKEEVVIYAPD